MAIIVKAGTAAAPTVAVIILCTSRALATTLIYCNAKTRQICQGPELRACNDLYSSQHPEASEQAVGAMTVPPCRGPPVRALIFGLRHIWTLMGLRFTLFRCASTPSHCRSHTFRPRKPFCIPAHTLQICWLSCVHRQGLRQAAAGGRRRSGFGQPRRRCRARARCATWRGCQRRRGAASSPRGRS